MKTKNKICFVVGSMAISGGTYVIIQHASFLQDKGYDVTLGVQEPFTAETLRWHDRAPTLRCLPIAEAKRESYDLVIATWWKTVFELKDFHSQRFAYFIQSIESRFYPQQEIPLRDLVDSTYAFPLSQVTEATWIQKYLAEKFSQNAALVRNGVRKDVYSPHGLAAAPRNAASPRVLVEGHFGVSFKNTALAVRLAKEAGCKDIWVMTGSPVKSLPGVKRVFSRIPMVKTPEIYRSCDILLKLSTVEGMFGPPLEMFHCGGTSIVFDVSGHDEYIVDGKNARVLQKNDMDGVVRTLRHLLNDAQALSQLKAGAAKTAEEWPDWEESSQEFTCWVDDALQGPLVEKETLVQLTAQSYRDYERGEKSRLENTPRNMPRHQLSRIAARFPAPVVRKVKQLESAWEVLFGPRKVF